jgi:hypothetical protein
MATGQVAEQVAEGLEEAAEVTRQIDFGRVGFFAGGLGVGFAVGLFFGYRWNKEKIRAEQIKRADEEIIEIRKVLQERYAIHQDKPPLDEVVEERGYSVPVVEEPERPTRPPVVVEPARSSNEDKSKDDDWDYSKEVPKRNQHHPYVIHQDEYNAEEPGYQQQTWTYYAADDILVDEDDEVVVRPELIVGTENLRKFGHGSDDPDVVFIRNDRVQIEFEICRTLKSHSVEVLGLDVPEHDDET